MMNKILVIQTASLGDVILATPLLEKLHFLYPDAAIDFLLKKGTESLFASHPYLHNILIWDKSEDKYQHLIKLIKVVRVEKYDLVVNVQRFSTTGLITALSNATTTIGFNKNPFSIFFSKSVKHKIGVKYNGIHEVERNMELLAHLPCTEKFTVKLYPSDKDFTYVSQYKLVLDRFAKQSYLEPVIPSQLQESFFCKSDFIRYKTAKYICIAPASLWKTKQFPAEKWVEFLKVIDKNLRVYFLGSKNDSLLCDEIISQSGHENSLNLSGKLTMLQSAALMKDAFMNYVNDSSPLHLASATNARVIAIFCSTIPEFGFGPLSDDAVVVAVKEKLDCRPCGLHGYKECPEKHFKCAYDIDINQLKFRLSNDR